MNSLQGWRGLRLASQRAVSSGSGWEHVFSRPDPGRQADVLISSFSPWEAEVWQGGQQAACGLDPALTAYAWDLR